MGKIKAAVADRSEKVPLEGGCPCNSGNTVNLLLRAFFVFGEYIVKHCKCGCGLKIENNKSYIKGHHLQSYNEDRKKKPVIINNTIHWRCSTCRDVFTENEFYKSNETNNRLKPQCKKCFAKSSVAWRKPEVRRKSRKKTYLKNKKLINKKCRIYNIVCLAVKTGELIKPTNCTICKDKVRLVGHHKDYSKPLDVQWICDQCHSDLHRGLSICQSR